MLGVAGNSSDFVSFRIGGGDAIGMEFNAGETLIWIGVFLLVTAAILIWLADYILRPLRSTDRPPRS